MKACMPSNVPCVACFCSFPDSTLAFMLLFTLTNVVMRAFGKPIVGDFEIISFLGAVVIGFAIPYTSLCKGHIAVDFLLAMLPRTTSDWINLATRIIAIALFSG